MGVFDIFGKKKQKQQEAADFLKLLIQIQKVSTKDGVESDDIAKGYGPFGLCETNPVPTYGILGSMSYLSRLRTKDGRSIENSRVGTTRAREVTEGISIFTA